MAQDLDLLLVTPSSAIQVYQGLGSEIAAIEPPVWSGLIAEFMLKKGYSVAILDAEALVLTHEETAQRIKDASPKLCVYVVYGQQPSASTQCMTAARLTALAQKKLAPEIPTVVMGTHASAIPGKTLAEEPYDFVCQGEGPYTVLGLLEAIKAGKLKWSEVPGLWWKDGDAIRGNKPAAKIQDLDAELPRQAWELLDMSLYRAHNWHCFDHIDKRKPYASLQTSLGCPFHCSFCCINAPFGGAGIRYWSPDNIIGQIDTLVNKYGVMNIKIPDEMFVLNEAHVIGICDRVIERGYKLNFWAYARVDTVKDRFLEKLKKAGFNWLCLGIESGSKHVRDGVEKGRFGDIDIEKTVRKIQSHGIYVLGNYIFGLPDDTYESMQDTLDMAIRLNCEWANFYSGMAYPGSQLYTMAIEKQWPMPSEWIGFSQHSFETLPLPTETLSGAQVLEFRDKAFMQYFKNPEYLSMLERKFGKPVRDHLAYVLKHEIRRRHTVEVPELNWPRRQPFETAGAALFT